MPVLEAVSGEKTEDAFAASSRLQEITGVPVPASLAALSSKAVLHKDVVDPARMMAYVRDFGGKKHV